MRIHLDVLGVTASKDIPITSEELSEIIRLPDDPSVLKTCLRSQRFVIRKLEADLESTKDLLEGMCKSRVEMAKAKTIAESTLDRFRWRPISEIHEDLGPCVLININDPGDLSIGGNLDLDWNESRWTHFHQIAPLTHEQAEVMKREMEAAR